MQVLSNEDMMSVKQSKLYCSLGFGFRGDPILHTHLEYFNN